MEEEKEPIKSSFLPVVLSESEELLHCYMKDNSTTLSWCDDFQIYPFYFEIKDVNVTHDYNSPSIAHLNLGKKSRDYQGFVELPTDLKEIWVSNNNNENCKDTLKQAFIIGPIKISKWESCAGIRFSVIKSTEIYEKEFVEKKEKDVFRNVSSSPQTEMGFISVAPACCGHQDIFFPPFTLCHPRYYLGVSNFTKVKVLSYKALTGHLYFMKTELIQQLVLSHFIVSPMDGLIVFLIQDYFKQNSE